MYQRCYMHICENFTIIQQYNDNDKQQLHLRQLRLSNAWQIACDIRKQLLDYLGKHAPHYLPQDRIQVKESALPRP